jgi:hypothetical protein
MTAPTRPEGAAVAIQPRRTEAPGREFGTHFKRLTGQHFGKDDSVPCT